MRYLTSLMTTLQVIVVLVRQQILVTVRMLHMKTVAMFQLAIMRTLLHM